MNEKTKEGLFAGAMMAGVALAYLGGMETMLGMLGGVLMSCLCVKLFYKKPANTATES